MLWSMENVAIKFRQSLEARRRLQPSHITMYDKSPQSQHCSTKPCANPPAIFDMSQMIPWNSEVTDYTLRTSGPCKATQPPWRHV
eukprot:scaffold5979_cov34-Prasinocladus_malaysianus.AAC.1